MTHTAKVLAGALAGLALAASFPAASAQAPRKFTVPFDPNQSALSKEGQAALGAAVEMAQECANASLSITGYDDGERAAAVSTARAEAVKKAIVDAGGVNASAMKIEGKPLAAGSGDRQNHRVEISVACS